MTKPDTSFGSRMRQCRELLGLSQVDLAAITGLAASHINHFETGRREPNIDNLRKIKQALKVPYEMLLGGQDTGND